MAAHIQRHLAGLQQAQQLFLQGALQGLRPGQLLARHALRQAPDDIEGCVDTGIRQQQPRLQFLHQLRVDFLAPQEQGSQPLYQRAAGLAQAAPQASKESGLRRGHWPLHRLLHRRRHGLLSRGGRHQRIGGGHRGGHHLRRASRLATRG